MYFILLNMMPFVFMDMKEGQPCRGYTASTGVWKHIDHGPQSADGGSA
jgi:hypothetical protein